MAIVIHYSGTLLTYRLPFTCGNYVKCGKGKSTDLITFDMYLKLQPLAMQTTRISMVLNNTQHWKSAHRRRSVFIELLRGSGVMCGDLKLGSNSAGNNFFFFVWGLST